MTDKEFINKYDNAINFSVEDIFSIYNGFIGRAGGVSESPDGQFTRTFQVEGRWFRVYWTEPIFDKGMFKIRIREMQSKYDYIHSLNIHDLAEYLRNFSTYCKTRDDDSSLCEIKHMLAEFREDCM